MKKKILTLMFLLIFTPCLSSLLIHNTAKADETAVVNQIIITQYPSKIIYSKGESLDLSDMIVQGYYSDQTTGVISDYEVQGYDSNKVGTQNVYLVYQNVTATFNVTVIPAKVTNISVASSSTTGLTLTWDADPNATRYDIYSLDELTGVYNLISFTGTNSITLSYLPGTVHTYQICAVEYIDGIEYKSNLSDPYTAATNPEMVTGLTVTGTTTNSVSLNWSQAAGATGYLVYRSPASSNNFSYLGTASDASYIDQKAASGTSYKYQVCAYTLNNSFVGTKSSIVETSTNPAKVSLKYKAGDQKIRFTWATVTGATSYDIYMGDDVSGFSLLTTRKGNSSTSYMADGLTTGSTYSFYAVAHREYNGVTYDSPASNVSLVTLEEIPDTSTEAKIFPTVVDFKSSWAFSKIGFFGKYVNYSKSYIIPGLITTNVGGFSSTTMCPQGITFTEDYLLITAYDIATEENSVVYVLDKNTKELLTTLILPSKTHAGSIGYDGTNLWIPTGTRISSVPVSEVEAAVQTGEPYTYIKYNTTCILGIAASYITYYDEKLWVGSYNELQSTNMYSYIIGDKDSAPTLTKADTIIMPTRVQGVAFTSMGTMILSRSCQLYQGLRGYMRQLDVYKPDYSKAANGVISLGNLVNSVDMPSMNEDIAIDGSYLYVNFESGAFTKSSYKMDRICAFKLTSVTKKSVYTKLVR